MAPKGKQGLTHDEIWDDSALVDSWNEALEEYKKYHSIHVKGGNVDDLLNENDTSDAKHEEGEQPALHPPGEPQEAKQPPGPNRAAEQGAERAQDTSVGSQDGTRGIRHSHSPAPGPAPVPAGLLGTVRDEGLKRLLMSWYYAGYYTGYYEGQRERQQDGESGQP